MTGDHSNEEDVSRFVLLVSPFAFVVTLIPMEFPTTQWSLLAQATLRGDAEGRDALAEFVRRYQEPIKAFIRRRGIDPLEAEDLAQGFFVHVMEKAMLRRADATRGRFRSFLLGALTRFLAHEQARRSTLKRGGATPPLALDEIANTPAEPATPPAEVQAYDRDWAVQLLRQSLATVEAEWAQRGRTDAFAVLRTYLPGSPSTPPYEESAARLGMALAAFKTDVHRLREQLRKVLRREIAATVASPEDLDDEVAYLGRVLQSAQG